MRLSILLVSLLFCSACGGSADHAPGETVAQPTDRCIAGGAEQGDMSGFFVNHGIIAAPIAAGCVSEAEGMENRHGFTPPSPSGQVTAAPRNDQ